MPDNIHRSVLQIALEENLSAGAKGMAEAVAKAAATAKQLDEVLAHSNASQRFQEGMRRIGASVSGVEGATKALKALAEAEGIAADRSAWTSEQAKQYKNLENVTLATARAQMRAEDALTKARAEAAAAAIRDADRVASERIRDAERVAAAEQRLRDRELVEMRRHSERIAEERRATMERMSFRHYLAQGVAAGVSAHGVMSGAEFAVEKGAELQNARLSMRSAGIDSATAARIEQQSLDLSTRYGNVSESALIELAKEARSVVTNPEELFKIMPSLAAAKSALDAGGVKGGSEGLGALVKGAESIGAAKDPERLAKLVEAYVKAIQVMGTTISPEKIYDFDKNARLAGAQFSDRFLMTTAMSTLQEMGGQSAGKAANQAVTELTSGLGNRTVAVKELMDLGLVDRNDVRFNKTGEVSGVRKGGLHPVARDSLLASDPDKWLYDVLLPAMSKHGLSKESDQIAAIRQIFSGSVAAQDMMGKFLVQRESYAAHAGRFDTGAGFGATADKLNSATAGVVAFNDGMANLLANATSPLMPIAGRALFDLSKGLNAMAGWSKDHPLAASTGAIGITAGSLAGAGYLGMKALNGFGLGASATALDASATALTMSAGELTAAAALMGGKGGIAAEVAKDAAKVGAGAGVLSAGTVAAAVAAGAAVMGGTVWGLNKLVPNKAHGPIPDAKSASDPRTKDDFAFPPQHLYGRTNLPFAPDNSAVGQGTGRGFLHRTAYEDGGDFTGLSSSVAMIARGTQQGFEAAFRNLMGTGTTNGLSGGGGLIQAAYETEGGPVRGFSRSSLPSLRYGRDAMGGYRLTPGADGPIDHFTAAGRTFASKAPDLMHRMMKDFGLGPEQAAVIMGNLGHESSGFTAFHEKGLPWEKGGIGWAQWTGSRRREFEAWTQANHLDPRSDEANYGFLKHELMTNPRYRHALDRLRASKGTPQDMADFEKVFEGAGIKAYGSRWAYDRKALKALHDAESGVAGREPQGPRLPERAPRKGTIEAMNTEPVTIFDHDHLHETEHLLDRISTKVARMNKVSVSIAHGPRENGRPVHMASPAEVGRQARSVPSTSGSTFV